MRDGLVGNAGEMAETDTLREMNTKLDIAKGECDDLQYVLDQILEECKRLQWLLEHERGGATTEEPHTSNELGNRYSREDIYSGDNDISDEKEKYCDY